MNEEKRKFGRKLLSFLLTLAMVMGLVSGMSLTAYAATDTYTMLKNNVTVVHFNNFDWYIIEDNSTSATEGTVTLTVSGTLEAAGGTCGVYIDNVTVNEGANLIATGTGDNGMALYSNVVFKNAKNGTGWTDVAGTTGKTKIEANTTGHGVSSALKRVQIPSLPDASVTTTPTANTLTYTGSAQQLVTAGIAESGTMQYAMGTDNSIVPTTGWSADIPTRINAGEYYVWYKAVGDDDQVPLLPFWKMRNTPETC